MSTRNIAAIAAVLMIVIGGCLVLMLDNAYVSDVDADTTDTSQLKEASGKTGTGTSAASWSYDLKYDVLTITSGTSGSSVSAFNSSSSSSWSSWTLTSLEFNDDTTNSTVTGYYPDNIFDSGGFKVVFSGDPNISADAFENIKATSISFTSTTSNTIEASAFAGCTTLTSVDFTNVTTVGASAFEGCTKLGSGTNNVVDIEKATINETAFAGCTGMTDIKATGSTAYTVVDKLLYSDSSRTMYFCPPGYKPTNNIISSVPETVTKINLNDSSVTYVIDLLDIASESVQFNEITGCKATGIAYSSLGMETSSVTYSSGKFTLTYTLYDGWNAGLPDRTSSPDVNITVSTGKIEAPITAGKGYTILPMGVTSLTYDDIYDLENIGGWSIDDVIINTNASGVVEDVTRFTGTITGFTGNGDATLGNDMTYHGLDFTVTALRPMGDDPFGSIVNLTIEGDMKIAQGTFANLTGLKTVVMNGITDVPERMFRYCTYLTSVSMTACTSIGEYAFEGCSSLGTVSLGAESVEVGDGAFSNCNSLDMIVTKKSTSVTGDLDVFLVHCDQSVDLSLSGDNLIIEGSGFKTLSYSTTVTGQGQSGTFYAGGFASVYIGGMDQVYLTLSQTGTASTQCLIVLDSQLGFEVDSLVVDSGDKLADLPVLSHDGYTFLGWEAENGTEVTDDSTASTSMVLIAQWQKENTPDNTPTYILVLFVIAIVATVAVLFVNSRR